MLALALGAILTGCSGESTADRPRAEALSEDGGSTVALVRRETARRPPTLVEAMAENVDPSRDGWNSEVLSAAASKRLKEIGKILEAPPGTPLEGVEAWVDEEFVGRALRPNVLEEAYSDGVFTIRRWQKDRATGESHRGAKGFELALETLRMARAADGEVRVTLKPVAIEEGSDSFSTHVFFDSSLRERGRGLQRNALWNVEWAYPVGKQPPRLRAVEIERYEEVSFAGDGGRLFDDCTQSVLGANESYETQVLPGINHWLGRVSLIAGMTIVGFHGLAVGDVDGDGLEDLYVCDAAGLPNRLFVQNPDGTARDESAAAGVDWLEASSSALFVDLDGDGDQDLAVALRRGLLLHENDGRGRFTLRADHKNLVTRSSSLSAADYDEDGDLDLYVCGYDGDPDNKGLPGPVPYNDAENGGANVLLANRGGFRFEDVTAESGLDVNNTRWSFASAWDDYDGDGDLDLYVANDYGRNNLYRNRGAGARPRFEDVAPETGVEDVASGMSAAWGDYNRDGRPDIYVSNMFSSAGGRIADKTRFAESASEPTTRDLQRMARGNTLFENAGGHFRDVSVESGATMGRWAWGSKFADLNNDSWPDVVVTNGYVTNDDSGDL